MIFFTNWHFYGIKILFLKNKFKFFKNFIETVKKH